MKFKHLLAATASVLAFALAAAPAMATPQISLKTTWSTGTPTHVTGSAPTLDTGSDTSSNAGFVNPPSNPFTQTLTQNVPASTWMFVAEPNGNSHSVNSMNIPLNITLSDGTGFGAGTVSFTAYMNYYANFNTEQDDMSWTASPVSNPGYLDSAHGSSFSATETLSDGVKVKVVIPYETDWDMAQQITYTYLPNDPPPTVPEPMTLALLGSALAGLGLVRRRRA